MRISIVGAGPAGAMAALRLAQAGAEVALFDHTHPREKPCGGGLTGRALELVADCIDIASLPAVVAKTATVESPISGQTAAVDLADCGATPASSLLILSRAVFDRALVDAAVREGARLIPERVTGVVRRGDSMIVGTTRSRYESDFVCGADGVASVVRKKLGVPFSRSQLSVASGFFLHGVTSSAVSIKSMTGQPGYLWSFPRPDHLAIGICAPAETGVKSEDLRSQAQQWIASHGLRRSGNLTSYSWPIPSVGSGSVDQMQCGGPGWMLLGDAAGLVDPLTREGIFYALLSGQWAAEALARTSLSNAPGVYSDRLRDEVQPELARAARLSNLFFTPAFSALLVESLQQSRAVRRVFADLVAGTQPYRGLRRRLLATHQWGLAGRALRLGLRSGFAGTMTGYGVPHPLSPV